MFQPTRVLIFVLAFVLPLGIGAAHLQANQENQAQENTRDIGAAIDAIKALGGVITTDGSPKKLVVGVSFRNKAGRNLTDRDLVHLKGLNSLQDLHLGGAKRITDAGLVHLKGLTQLQNLHLRGTQVTAAGLAQLKALTRLQDLRVTWTPTMFDAGEEPFEDAAKNLGKEQAIAAIRQLGGGITVNAAGPGRPVVVASFWGNKNFTDTDWAHLGALTDLEELYFDESSITDVGLARLKGLTHLKYLDLDSAHQITDAGLAHLKGLTQLENLDLLGDNITDVGLAHLSGMTNLQNLGLFGTQITDAGLVHLEGLTHLEYLNLKGTQVGDAGLEHLRGLAKLEELNLYGTKITDAGLEYLKGLPKLHRVWLGNTQATEEGANKLKQAIPGLEVMFDRSGYSWRPWSWK